MPVVSYDKKDELGQTQEVSVWTWEPRRADARQEGWVLLLCRCHGPAGLQNCCRTAPTTGLLFPPCGMERFVVNNTCPIITHEACKRHRTHLFSWKVFGSQATILNMQSLRDPPGGPTQVTRTCILKWYLFEERLEVLGGSMGYPRWYTPQPETPVFIRSHNSYRWQWHSSIRRWFRSLPLKQVHFCNCLTWQN